MSTPGSAHEDLTRALERVRPRLGALARSLHYFPVVGSTNDVAMSLASDGAVVLADEQTAGRGRRGHSWFSPPGSGLYVSVVLAPAARAAVDATRATKLLTLAAGVALANGIESSTGLRVDLKWPNDLYVARRKLAGILAEASGNPPDLIVVGYGINVASTAYPPELGDQATSLESELGQPIDRFLVFAETLAALASQYDDLLAGRFDAILDAWRRQAPGATGARVSWTTSTSRSNSTLASSISDAPRREIGVTAGIDADGALLVRVKDPEGRVDSVERIERIVAGELTWL